MVGLVRPSKFHSAAISAKGKTTSKSADYMTVAHRPQACVIVQGCDVCGGHRLPLQQEMIIRARKCTNQQDGATIEAGRGGVTSHVS